MSSWDGKLAAAPLAQSQVDLGSHFTLPERRESGTNVRTRHNVVTAVAPPLRAAAFGILPEGTHARTRIHTYMYISIDVIEIYTTSVSTVKIALCESGIFKSLELLISRHVAKA